MRTDSELLGAEIAPPKWAIPNLLPTGVTVFAGKPKLGKSWLGLEIALKVAYGEPFGAFEPNQGPVLYLGLEDSEFRLQARLRKLLGKREPTDAAEFATEWSTVEDGGLRDLRMWIESMPEARVIVIDVMRKLDRIGYSYNRDAEKIEALGKLGRELDVAIIAVMHQYKGRAISGTSPDWIDKVQGSMGVTAAADAIWLLARERDSEAGVLRVTGKDVPEQAIALTFDPETCQWTVDGAAPEPARQLSDERAAILAIVEAHPGLSLPEIALLAGQDRDTVRPMLWRMVQGNDLRRVERAYYTPAQAEALATQDTHTPRGENARTPERQNAENARTAERPRRDRKA